MVKATMLSFAAAACALLLAMPAAAADKAKVKTESAKATRPAAVRSMWPAETLSGKIMMVKPDEKLVVVKGPDGVPFDMVVTRKTHIRSGERSLNLKDLTQQTNESVSVKFVPERGGDVAQSIRVTG